MQGPRLILTACLVLTFVPSLGECDDQAGYAARIEAKRRNTDEEYRDPRKSPLCAVAVTSLDRPRTTIGSSPGVDLLLRGETIAPVHAEVVRTPGADGASTVWLLRPVAGDVTDEKTGQAIQSVELVPDQRYRVGKYAIVRRQLGTFGPVLRAFDTESPALAEFKGLRYFAPDPSFRVTAEVIPDAVPKRITVLDTNGWKRDAWRYGEARFELAGRNLALALWLFTPEPKEKDEFFIAFKDKTAGHETYGGGRFLDVPFIARGALVIDFNEAYNPSCAYSTGFACPIPPRENILPIEIRAGEKTYPRKH